MAEFGRRKSFSFFEEDRSSKVGPGARTPVHHQYCAGGLGLGAGAGGRRSPARLSTSAVPIDHHQQQVAVGGGCSPWVQSPLHGRVPPPAAIYHCLAALHRLDGDVHALALARGVLFTASDSGRVRAWAAPGCFNLGYLDVGRGRVPALAAGAGTLVTSHTRDHHVRVWTLAAHAGGGGPVRARKAATLPPKSSLLHHLGMVKRHPHQHSDTVSCLALHTVAGLLYTGSHDQTVKAWKLAGGGCVDSFLAHDGPVTAVLVNDADGCVFTASADGTVKMWRRVYGGATHALIIVLRSPELFSPVNALALCSSARRKCFLYAGSSDGYVNVWEKDASAGRPVHADYLPGHRLAVFCLASGCGGRVVVSGSEDATMRVWRRDGGGSTSSSCKHTCLAVIEGHRGPVRCLAVGGGDVADGSSMVVYSAGLDRSVKVWRIRVVGKDDDEDDDDDEEEEEEPDIVMASGKVDEADIAMAGPGKEDVDEEEEEVVVSPTPILSPVWVEKRRHASRG